MIESDNLHNRWKGRINRTDRTNNRQNTIPKSQVAGSVVIFGISKGSTVVMVVFGTGTGSTGVEGFAGTLV